MSVSYVFTSKYELVFVYMDVITYPYHNPDAGLVNCPGQQDYCYAIVDTRPISLFLFFFNHTFDLCILIISLYLNYFIH